MKRHIPGLHMEAPTGDDITDGLFLVRVERAQYRWSRQKPFFQIRFRVLQPAGHADRTLLGRVYCTPKAMWKLSWFLRDFGYDTELFGRDEVDENRLVGLCGVVKISRADINGHSFLNLDAFAPAGNWEELSGAAVISSQVSAGAGRDL